MKSVIFPNFYLKEQVTIKETIQCKFPTHAKLWGTVWKWGSDKSRYNFKANTVPNNKPYFQVNRTFSGVTCEKLCFWLGKMKYYMKKIGSQKLESQYPTAADIKCAPISMQQLEKNKPR